MTRLTWLHLSDWHQKGNDFDRQVVCDALIRDISNRAGIDPSLTQVDFIVFSGDLAFHGKQAEYETAQKYFLAPVLEATGLRSDRLFIVPGNHDLDYDTFELLPPALQRGLNEEECKNWLNDQKKLKRLLEPFEAFSKFVSKYTSLDSPDYASIRMWPDLGGKKVALLGLNSAWMCGRNKDNSGKINDYGFTLLGEPQIHDALAQIAEADVRLVILHHPFEWLAEFDRRRVEKRLGEAAHFILCGHEHLTQIRIIKGTSGDSVIIHAGASYGDRTATDSRYMNAYNFVSLDLSAGKGTVYLRRWNDRQSKWIEDIESCKGGEYKFDLPKNLATDQANHSSSFARGIRCAASPISEPSMNLESELDAFEKIATGKDTQTRLILVTGEGGMGKSHLLNLYKQVADTNKFSVISFALGTQILVENCISQIVSHFGCQHFEFYDDFLMSQPFKPMPPAEEKGWQSNLTRQFFKDVGNCSNMSPVAIFFDQHEKSDPAFKNWLTHIFLPYLSFRYPIVVVIAGRETIEPPPSAKGCTHFPLKGVNVDWFHRYVEDCKVNLDSKMIVEFHKLLKGRPKDFVEYVKTLPLQGAVS